MRLNSLLKNSTLSLLLGGAFGWRRGSPLRWKASFTTGFSRPGNLPRARRVFLHSLQPLGNVRLKLINDLRLG